MLRPVPPLPGVRAPRPALHPRALWQRPAQSDLRATWLGHSTVLIEIGGHRVLTDPVWGARASPTRLAGPKRFQPVSLARIARAREAYVQTDLRQRLARHHDDPDSAFRG